MTAQKTLTDQSHWLKIGPLLQKNKRLLGDCDWLVVCSASWSKGQFYEAITVSSGYSTQDFCFHTLNYTRVKIGQQKKKSPVAWRLHLINQGDQQVTQKLNVQHPQHLGDSFWSQKISQVVRWKENCVQTVLGQLGLTANILRQTAEGLQIIA